MVTKEDLLDLGLNDDPGFIFDPTERVAAVEKIQLREATITEQQMSILRARKVAVSRVFRDGNASLDDIAIVKAMLHKFGRWRETTFHTDPRLHAVLEGRREVLLLLDDYCELSVEELHRKFA